MLKIIKDSTLVPTPIVDLKLDAEPRQGSTDPVTSEGVANAIAGASGALDERLTAVEDCIPDTAGADNKLVTQSALDAAEAGWQAGYTPKGEASVSTLNGLTGQSNGDTYILTDSGTLSAGSLAVSAGDSVAWDDANSKWYKVSQYALEQFGINEIHNLSTTATEDDLASGNYIPIDGSAGTKKAPGNLFAQKSVQENTVSSLASEFKDTKPYSPCDIVNYQGSEYAFIESHSAGAWNAGHAIKINIADQLKTRNILNLSIEGQNTVIIPNAYLVNGFSFIDVDIDNSNWTLANDTNPDHVILSVKMLSRSSAPRILLEKKVSDGVASIPDSLHIEVRDGEEMVYIVVRCDSGKTANFTLKDKSNSVLRGSVVNKEFFEQGNISMSVNSLTYSGSVSRVRTRPSTPFSMKAGDRLVAKSGYAFYVAYSESGTNPYTTKGWVLEFTAPSDIKVHIVARKNPEATATVDDIIPAFYCSSTYSELNPANKRTYRPDFIKSINHRGFNTVAPENTLPAFRLSAKFGFKIVETDVHETADGHIVCIHDDTVDRTSDGSGNVADMTLAELKALDFGSWKNAIYAGTRIPTFEEFLVCCRNLGLEAYVEIKVAGIGAKLVSIARSLGMEKKVTYISFGDGWLEEILAVDSHARVGLVRETFGASAISWINTNKTQYNDVFLDAAYILLTDESKALVKNAGIPLEVWTVEAVHMLAADPYISGFTSNSDIAADLIYNAEMNK